MKIYVRPTGMYCERGPVSIKGTLGASVGTDRRELFTTRTVSVNFFPTGDERPITLATGDFFVTVSIAEFTIRTGDSLGIGGDILGGNQTLVPASDFVGLAGPKTYHVRFGQGNQVVRADFEVEVPR